MFSSRVFLSCGLRIAFACGHRRPRSAKETTRTTVEWRRRRRRREKEVGFWCPYQRWTYSEPCLVEVGLVVAGDDLLDEVPRGGEMAALAEQEGGAVAADGPLASVEDSVEVAVDPVVVARHLRAPARRSRRDRGGDRVGARRREEKTGKRSGGGEEE
jgi:hypothetical protein